ncbi:hypothetical protein B0H13DRAFT_1865071 [Mycena leptocephala]|nr:hypothetical protein B0H13DRAFT_1865071 [Mycena leptocephala]
MGPANPSTVSAWPPGSHLSLRFARPSTGSVGLGNSHSPPITVTFLDSHASDHFLREHSDFTRHEAIPMHTGKSALPSDGDIAIVGKGTVSNLFRVAGKTVHITFRSANLISVSQLDKASYWSKFGGGEVSVCEGKDGDDF